MGANSSLRLVNVYPVEKCLMSIPESAHLTRLEGKKAPLMFTCVGRVMKKGFPVVFTQVEL